MTVDKGLPSSCNANTCVDTCARLCVCVSSCLKEARCWHTTDPQLACGGSLFYSQWGDWTVTVCVCAWDRVCVAAAMSPRRLLKPPGSSSAQVKHSDKVVPASAGWEQKPPFTVIWSLISMFWTTDVFYVKKYTFYSMKCLHWQGILTDIMVAVCHCYYTVNIASVPAKLW